MGWLYRLDESANLPVIIFYFTVILKYYTVVENSYKNGKINALLFSQIVLS